MDKSTIEAARKLVPPGHIYADWAASALPLITSEHIQFVPPHHSSRRHLDAARHAVASFLGDTHHAYHVIFTSGTTASFQLLAHRLPWSPKAAFFCHSHVHNSLLGIRNVAAAKHGAQFASFRSHDLHYHLSNPSNHTNFPASSEASPPFAVLAYPGECNLTGGLYSLSWARMAKKNGFLNYSPSQIITIVDTAKLLSTSPFCIHDNPDIDALVFSLYKLSAAYTGLGALLIRKNSLLEALLLSTSETSFFAGGQSVQALSPFSMSFFAPAEHLSDLLQLGTPNMQAIHNLPSQLHRFPSSTMQAIHTYVSDIAQTFTRLLLAAFPSGSSTIHRDAFSVVKHRSGIVSFTLHRKPSGQPIGHNEVATILSINRIHIRAGSMCNIGACASVLQLSDEDVEEHHTRGHRCGDDVDLVNGRPTGVVRVSFGWGSIVKDAVTIVNVLKTYVTINILRHVLPANENIIFSVAALFVYPIKSCGGSPMKHFFQDGNGGVVGDRSFGIQDIATGRLLNIAMCPSLANISATYCKGGRILEVRLHTYDVKGKAQFSFTRVDIETYNITTSRSEIKEGSRQSIEINTKCEARLVTRKEVSQRNIDVWLSTATGRNVRLVHLDTELEGGRTKRNVLIVSAQELLALRKMSKIDDMEILLASIRPNIVLKEEGYISDEKDIDLSPSYLASRYYSSFQSDCVKMEVSRNCTRCKVVNVICSAKGIESTGEPLRSVAKLNRRNGQKGLVFGLLAKIANPKAQDGNPVDSCIDEPCLKVGEKAFGYQNACLRS